MGQSTHGLTYLPSLDGWSEDQRIYESYDLDDPDATMFEMDNFQFPQLGSRFPLVCKVTTIASFPAWWQF
jgi:hypothetical protein